MDFSEQDVKGRFLEKKRKETVSRQQMICRRLRHGIYKGQLKTRIPNPSPFSRFPASGLMTTVFLSGKNPKLKSQPATRTRADSVIESRAQLSAPRAPHLSI